MAKNKNKTEMENVEMETPVFSEDTKNKIKEALERNAAKAPKRKVEQAPSLAGALAQSLEIDKHKVRRIMRKFKDEFENRKAEMVDYSESQIWETIIVDYAEGKLTKERTSKGANPFSKLLRAARVLHLDLGYTKEDIIQAIENGDLTTKGTFGKKKEVPQDEPDTEEVIETEE